ncbi:MAG: NAD(P)/FAD-dependent oxidoreductase [Alphaproteobacteria bacterium]
MQTVDIAVVGGGMVGAAIGYGLASRGAAVAILDEGDTAFRAARGNFGLVWVQTKGLGMQRYADWTRQSADLYPDFAAELRETAGIDVAYEKPGGLTLCLGDAEYENQSRVIGHLRQQAGPGRYDGDMVSRRDVETALPGVTLGREVTGGSWCPHDGHVTPLRLLRAMHAGFAGAGGRYLSEHRVESISPDGSGGFVLKTAGGDVAAGKVVLAAGHGIPRLAPMVGLTVPTQPERGQVLVTERVRRFLPMPISSVRQTVEGSVMIGNSNEDVGFDDGTTLDVSRTMAARAVRIFPALARLRLVRTWGALRVLPPDKFPIYAESESCPGAFVATMHSGVTLAAVHARRLPDWILEGRVEEGFETFGTARFDVQAAA